MQLVLSYQYDYSRQRQGPQPGTHQPAFSIAASSACPMRGNSIGAQRVCASMLFAPALSRLRFTRLTRCIATFILSGAASRAPRASGEHLRTKTFLHLQVSAGIGDTHTPSIAQFASYIPSLIQKCDLIVRLTSATTRCSSPSVVRMVPYTKPSFQSSTVRCHKRASVSADSARAGSLGCTRAL
jgi:hypothetical protein